MTAKKKNMHLFQPQYWTMWNDKKVFWLPYSVGCVWSYIAQFPEVHENWQLTGLHYWREPIPRVLEKMQDPHVCGFSCYVWNEQYCLTLAEKIKQQWPHCIIVVGGPQVNAKYLEYSFVDHIIMAEGEEAMLDLVKQINQNTTPPALYKKQRLSNLDIPSPYLTGVFDTIMAEDPNVMWHAVLETNRGCPYACTFCDWGGVTYSKIKTFDLKKIEKELSWIATHNINDVFLADANFGILKDRDWQIANSIKKVFENSFVDYIVTTYAKFSNEHVFKIAKTLEDYNRGMTLSMQSMNPATLKAIKRDNLAINDLKTMLALSKKYDVPAYTEMILGLPLETLDSWKAGLCELMEIGQHHFVEIYPASVLENAELNAQRLLYGIKTAKVPDYMLGSYYENAESDKIIELNDVVVATNTMNVKDMHEAWMYGWTVLQWHYGGYAQILARYLNSFHQISYRTFYDRIFEGLQTKKDSVGALYQNVLDAYNSSVENRPIQTMHQTFNYYLKDSFKIKQCMIDYAIEIAGQFTALDKDVIELQNNFLVDLDLDHDTIYHSSFNPVTWAQQAVQYKLSVKSKKVAQYMQNLAFVKRRGWHTHRIDILSR